MTTAQRPGPPMPVAAHLRARLRDAAAPVLVEGDRTLPGATLWVAARTLVRQLRAAGLGPGDRVLVRTGDDLLVAVALVAGLTGGFTTALTAAVPPGGTPADAVDARLVLCAASDLPDGAGPDGAGLPPWVAVAGIAGLADPDRVAPRAARHAPEPDVALLLHTSGSTGRPTWVALSQGNLDAVLASHLPVLFGDRWDAADAARRPAGVIASVLPWTHAFGAVLDLLVGLLAADVVLRDRRAGADPHRLAALLERAGDGAWLSAVPLSLRRFADAVPDARERLHRLGGGLVGGASCEPALCAVLAGSALRIGYGLTEAAPGVCLGDRGAFSPGLLGTPVGCRTEVVGGQLVVTGANVSVGVLDADGALVRRSVPRLPTGDTVRDGQRPHVYGGRVHDTVKLSSGRWVSLLDVDAAVLASTGVACAAQATDDAALVLLVDGDHGAARTVRTWLGHQAVPWTRAVRDVVAVPSGAWPRSPKGELVRRPDPAWMPQPERTGQPT